MHDQALRTDVVTHAPRIVSTAPVSPGASRTFAELEALTVNFDPIGFDAAARDPAWRTDQRRTDLTPEPPGPPIPGGSFEVASELLRTYEVADPRLVRAVYDAASPFDGRDMLLIGRFAGLRFPMGVRIGGVLDGREESSSGAVHRFAWHYRTLEGHLERGQMDYEVVKDPETGRVEFGITAYSQRGDIDSWIVRTGFGIFGRPTQLRFYARALRRMQERTAARAVA